MNPSAENVFHEVERLLDADSRVLIASEFDGTLCRIAETPGSASVSPAMLRLLSGVTASANVLLTVMSGRGVDDLSSRLPVDAVFAGNHGLEIRGRGLAFEHGGAKQLRPQLAAACAVLRELVRGWPGAWVEDKRLSATVHYRNADPRGHHRLLVTVRRALAQFGSALALRCGKQAVEIRPRVEWDRHAAIAWIRDQAGPFDKCVWVGEDRADETQVISAVRVPASDPVTVALLFSGILRSGAGKGLVAAG